MASVAVPGGSAETQGRELSTYRSYVTTLIDKNAKDESKLQAAQELSDNFEVGYTSDRIFAMHYLNLFCYLTQIWILQTILSSPQYPAFLDYAIKSFMKVLQEGEVYFIAEYHVQVSTYRLHLRNNDFTPSY